MARTQNVTRTIVCPLETSDRKNQKLQSAIDDFRRVLEVASEVLPTFDEKARKRNNTQIYRTVKAELRGYNIKDKIVQNAVHRAIENFRSAKELGSGRPIAGVESCDYLILTNQGYDVKSNNRGFGFKAKFIPYKSEWWHMDIGSHQRDHLTRALDGDAKLGQAEVCYNQGNPVVRIAISWEQQVTDEAEAECIVGVDVGYRSLYAAAVNDCESGDIIDVDIQSGAEYQHNRERMRRRLTRFKKQGRMDRANKLRARERRYTDHTMHEAARGVVNLAGEYSPCLIRLEDLTHYRERADEAVHQWPFNSLQEKIKEKAAEEGVGVIVEDPYYTSQTCRKCGYQDERNRHALQFECLSCGYEVNADLNAAMNLAQM